MERGSGNKSTALSLGGFPQEPAERESTDQCYELQVGGSEGTDRVAGESGGV